MDKTNLLAIIIALLSLLLTSCKSESNTNSNSNAILDTVYMQALCNEAESINYIRKNSLYVEDLSRGFYIDANNKIFRDSLVLSYKFFAIKNSDTLYMHVDFENIKSSGEPEWSLVPKDHESPNVIKRIRIQPKLYDTNRLNPNQTSIDFDYLDGNGNLIVGGESTGVVDNCKNIWLHPPRWMGFKILGLNPFPYIQEPFVKNHSWQDSLALGSHFSDEEWLVWDGAIKNIFNYTILGNRFVTFDSKVYQCVEVAATAKSEISASKLTFLFSDRLGFVRLEYDNVDGSQFHFRLMESE